MFIPCYDWLDFTSVILVSFHIPLPNFMLHDKQHLVFYPSGMFLLVKYRPETHVHTCMHTEGRQIFHLFVTIFIFETDHLQVCH